MELILLSTKRDEMQFDFGQNIDKLTITENRKSL